MNPGERLLCDGPTMERLIASMARQVGGGRRPVRRSAWSGSGREAFRWPIDWPGS